MIRIMIGSVGPKPGHRYLQGILPGSEDLPQGGWEVTRERAYRTRSGGASKDETPRSRKHVTALRGFKNKTLNRTLWCSVSSFASAADAESFLPGLIPRMVRRPGSKLEITGKRTIDRPKVPGTSGSVFYEERFSGPDGPGGTRLIGGAVGQIVFVIDFSGIGDSWPWDEALSIATAEVEKIKRSS